MTFYCGAVSVHSQSSILVVVVAAVVTAVVASNTSSLVKSPHSFHIFSISDTGCSWMLGTS